jgi:hypothetical protein
MCRALLIRTCMVCNVDVSIAGGTVGQACADTGLATCTGYGTAGFDATACCQQYSSMGFCTTSSAGFRDQTRTGCPLTCYSYCTADTTYGACGCTSAAPAPCTDFYAVNANCPLHTVGRLVPTQCDGACSTPRAIVCNSTGHLNSALPQIQTRK